MRTPILKDITSLSAEDTYIILDNPSNVFDSGTHYHVDFEINLVYNTEGVRVIGDELQQFHDFDLVMVGAGVYHSWHGKDSFRDAHVTTIRFRRDIFSEEQLAKKEFRSIKTMLEESRYGIQFSPLTAKNMVHYFNELVNETGFSGVLKLYLILNILADDAYHRIVKVGKQDLSINKSQAETIQRVCDFIHKNYERSISLEKVASIANLSLSGFNYFFKRCTHKSFTDYLMNYRISKASMLLIETDLSISEVSFKTGFSSVSYFNRIFNKIKGLNPSEYRQMMKRLL